MAAVEEVDTDLSVDGRVMEVLSEHLCEGWLEGYLLTGRHGLFSCYEAFIHVIDSMFNQHAKWLKVSRTVPWRKPIASLNYLLTSHVWRQDHNGFSHQDPGFIDHVANKKADVVRIYLPPDANCLLSVADHCLRSRNYINLIVAGKQPEWQWLDIESATRHCAAGAGIWHWASNDGGDPDVVMRPPPATSRTLETLAAVTAAARALLRIRIRVVNVVDLMALQPQSEHPHGMEDQDFDELFTRDKPVIFAFHGYPAMIHKLTYRRHNHDNIHVRGYKEEGTTTTPFDMVALNKPRPLSTRARCHQPHPAIQPSGSESGGVLLVRHGASQALYKRARRGHARGPRLAVEGLSAMTMTHSETVVLTLNSGSSSLKFGLYRAGLSRTEELLTGEADSIGQESGQFHAAMRAAMHCLPAVNPFATSVMRCEKSNGSWPIPKLPSPAVIGHRIVHGGPKPASPLRD